MDDAPTPAAPRFRGPRRSKGSPVGPEAVRRAVLDAAAALFADQGIAHTTRRDIAEAADVDPNLINRYVGSREQLISDVLDELAAELSAELVHGGFAQASHDPDSVIMRWMRIMSQVVATRAQSIAATEPNPVSAVARVGEEQLGLDARTAHVRAAQVTALSFGWRLLEPYLIAAGQLDDVSVDALRRELNTINRQILATPLAED